MRPDVWMSRPAIARSSVVLPQPDGPRKQTNSPRIDLERDVLQRGERAELLGQPLDAQVGRGIRLASGVGHVDEQRAAPSGSGAARGAVAFGDGTARYFGADLLS